MGAIALLGLVSTPQNPAARMTAWSFFLGHLCGHHTSRRRGNFLGAPPLRENAVLYSLLRDCRCVWWPCWLRLSLPTRGEGLPRLNLVPPLRGSELAPARLLLQPHMGCRADQSHLRAKPHLAAYPHCRTISQLVYTRIETRPCSVFRIWKMEIGTFFLCGSQVESVVCQSEMGTGICPKVGRRL